MGGWVFGCFCSKKSMVNDPWVDLTVLYWWSNQIYIYVYGEAQWTQMSNLGIKIWLRWVIVGGDGGGRRLTARDRHMSSQFVHYYDDSWSRYSYMLCLWYCEGTCHGGSSAFILFAEDDVSSTATTKKQHIISYVSVLLLLHVEQCVVIGYDEKAK